MCVGYCAHLSAIIRPTESIIHDTANLGIFLPDLETQDRVAINISVDYELQPTNAH
jgi:hypothetical protein